MINMKHVFEVSKYVNRNINKSDIYVLDLHQAGVKSKINCQGIYIPSRSEVLAQLGITKEQDEQNQELWKRL